MHKILFVLLLLTHLPANEVKKLVNNTNGFVVVEFLDGQARFYDPFLEAELKAQGVRIPPFLRERFQGKHAIFPGDPLFERAFVDVYDRYTIANPNYRWVLETP